jgi:hypothetical protein
LMRKRWRVIPGIAFTVTLLSGGWLLYCHLYPVPSSLAGVWENETQLGSAGPGEVRLVISRRGLIDIQLDRHKYDWWGSDQLHLHISISGDIAVVWSEPSRKAEVRFEVRDGRMTVSDPDRPDRPDDVMVFRRVP